MKYLAVVFLPIFLVLYLNQSLWAHGDAIHILGVVTKATKDQVVVKTTKGKTVTIAFDSSTTFQQDGIHTQDARPQVGDRLAAEVSKKGEALVAEEILFTTSKSK
jgi:hypothetical protein